MAASSVGQGGEMKMGLFYGALEDYNQDFRQKKVLIQEKEDRINFLKSKLEGMAKEDELLDRKIENLVMDSSKLNMEFERDEKAKEALENKKQSTEKQLGDINENIEKRGKLRKKIATFREERIAYLEEKWNQWEAQYRTIPGIEELVKVTEEFNKLVQTHKEKSDQVLEMNRRVLAQRKISIQNWKDFVNTCINAAKIRNELQMKQEGLKETKRRLAVSKQAEDWRSNRKTRLSDLYRGELPTTTTRIADPTKQLSKESALHRFQRERTVLQSNTNLNARHTMKQRLEQINLGSTLRHLHPKSAALPPLPVNNHSTGKVAKQSSIPKKVIPSAPTAGGKLVNQKSSKTHSVIADYLKLVKTNHQQPLVASTLRHQLAQSQIPTSSHLESDQQQQTQIPTSKSNQRYEAESSMETSNQESNTLTEEEPNPSKTAENSVETSNQDRNTSTEEEPNPSKTAESSVETSIQDRNTSIEEEPNPSKTTESSVETSNQDRNNSTEEEPNPSITAEKLPSTGFSPPKGNNQAAKDIEQFKTPHPKSPPQSSFFGSDFFSMTSAPSGSNAFSLFESPSSTQTSDGFQIGDTPSDWSLSATPVQSAGSDQSKSNSISLMDLFGGGFSSSSSTQDGMSFF